jgi:hypothetical protein
VPSLFTFLGAPVASFVGSSARLDVRCVTAPRRALLTVFRTNPVASFVGSSARVGRFVQHCSSQRLTPLYFGLQQLPRIARRFVRGESVLFETYRNGSVQSRSGAAPLQ